MKKKSLTKFQKNLLKKTMKKKFNKESKIDLIISWISIDQFKSNSCFGDSERGSSGIINRFRDNLELKYSLRSYYKYAKWINKIHIILGRNSEKPKWLKKHSKINLIKETELYNPVQENSETKKLFFTKIKNLSEYFLTSDDDFFIRSKLFKNELIKNQKPILNSVHGRKYDKDSDGYAHIPLIWKKKDYQKAIEDFKNSQYKFFLNMGCKRKNPFILIKKNLLMRDKVYLGKVKGPDKLINHRNMDNLKYELHDILSNSKYKYICINDDFSTSNTEIYNDQMKLMDNFYKKLYPEKAPWEY
jgi:hypothetical protein